jgi:peptide deformylase
MTVLPIRLHNDPVLRETARPVVDFDQELRRLVDDLTETMNDRGGAGLAAPQLDVSLRVSTFHAKLAEGELGHLVNPRAASFQGSVSVDADSGGECGGWCVR